MKRHNNYKPSGVDWIGDIPEHWKMSKLKHISDVVLGKMLTNDDKGNYLLKPYLRAANVNWLKVDVSDVKEMWFSPAELEKLRLKENDLLVSEGGEVGRTCIWQNEIEECFIQNSVHKISFPENFESKFFLYQFFYFGSIGYFDSIVNRISIAHLTGEKLKEIFVLFPSISEQTVIANYLDEKTEQIDKLIAGKQRLIELLKEERTAIINQAVTRGINPNAKFKFSGVDWIGDVPEHWEVKKLKYLIKELESGVSVNSSDEGVSDNEIGILKTSCVYNYRFEADQNKKVIQAEIGRVKCSVKASSIIISRMNTPELVGASGFVERDYPNLFLPDRLWQTVLNTDYKTDVKFLSLILVSSRFREVLGYLATGTSSSMKNISKDDLLNTSVSFPSYSEQLQIVEYIENESQHIYKTISKIEKEIELIKEYRTALISEVVTGKIKVV